MTNSISYGGGYTIIGSWPAAAASRGPKDKVTVTVFDGSPCSVGMPESVPALIAWLQEHYDAIPEECRRTARFSVNIEPDYGDYREHVRLTYERPQTAEELKEAADARAAMRAKEEQREREMLAALKAKFGEG